MMESLWVLYHMMEGFIELGETNIIPLDVITGVSSFFIIALGGTLIGILYGLFGGFITKYTDHVKVIEPLFVFVLGYLMYLTSEMMHLSGILALSFGGIVLRHYMEHNVSKKTATTIKYFMKMLANIAETIIFMFLGLSTIVDTLDWNLAFIFFSLFFCLVFRALGVMILSWFLNRSRTVKLTKIDQFIMAYGGLRGGIAFCLALALDEELIPEKRLFVTTTIVIVFFTVFVQGISIKPVVNALKVKRQTEIEPTMNEKIHETMIDHLMAGLEELTSRSSHNLMRTKFRRFNHKYLQPLLSKHQDKVKTTKIVHVYHELNEKDALKTTTLNKIAGTMGSSADLYEDHKRALIARSPMRRHSSMEDTVTLQRALHAGRPSAKWQMNRKHTLGDSQESINRVVYHKQIPNSSQLRVQPVVKNGRVVKSDVPVADDTSSGSESGGVTINFDPSPQETMTNDSSPLHTNNDVSLHEETIAQKILPWNDPSPTHMTDIPNNEPIIAQAPTWVNNLSYSHITETGSPYVSPQTTVIAQTPNNHKTIYSIFPPTKEEPVVSTQKNVVSSDYFPTPWGCTSFSEECPQVSPMVSETGERSEGFLHSMHTAQAPDHHHMIIPNHREDMEHSSKNSQNVKHLSAVASAPDFQYWKPLKKESFSDAHRLSSDSMLIEMAMQEGVKNRVSQWLKQADEDDANDADEENDDDDGPGQTVSLDNIENLEHELDLEMNGKP